MTSPTHQQLSAHIFSDERLYNPGRYVWEYLPTYAEACATQGRHYEILSSARRPRRYEIANAEWIGIKAEYLDIAARLRSCSEDHRCKSFACLICRRAFAQAQYDLLLSGTRAFGARGIEALSFVTIVPHGLRFPASTLKRCSTEQLQNWFYDRLRFAGLSQLPLVGVLEHSYEEVVHGVPYFQPHWHLLAVISQRERDGLPAAFPSLNPRNPAVDIRNVRTMGVFRYMCKVKEKGHRWAGPWRPVDPVARAPPPPRLRELLQWAWKTSPLQTLVFQSLRLVFDQDDPRFIFDHNYLNHLQSDH